MEDFEVRQALAVIKDRVNKIKEDEDWKQNMADQWNQADQNEKQYDTQSQLTTGSQKSKISQIRKEVEQKEQETKSQWDGSMTASERGKMTTEERMAAQIAS